MVHWTRLVRALSRCTGRDLVIGHGSPGASRGPTGRPPRRVAAGAVLAVAAAGVLTGCGSAAAGSREPAAGPHIVQPVRVSAAELAALPRATTFTTIPAAPRDPAPFASTNGLVLRPLTSQVVYAGPGKPPVAVLPATELGGQTWVPVIQSQPGWDRVLLPSRPNRGSGWIFDGGKNSSRLELRSSAYVIHVHLGARTLTVRDAGRVLGTWTVAIGAHGTPTPTGRTFLLALLAPPHPTYSPLILPLGFHSNTLDSFGGGPGTVAVHGWPDPSVFGHAISHGCVRVPDAALKVLDKIPLGSIVLITA